MRKIFKASVLAFMIAFTFSACGGSSGDEAKPVLYDLFDSYNTTTFPAGETPWVGYARTTGIWLDTNWLIGEDQVNLSAGTGLTQNSAFINNNYNKTNVACSASARGSISSSDLTTVQLGLILRATGNGSEHYAFVYYVDATDPLAPIPMLAIQKVDAAGTITVLGSPVPMANYLIMNASGTPFNPSTSLHTYRFSVSGTATLTFTAFIDGIQQLPQVTDPSGVAITPPITPITDSGSVYASGKAGFFVGNANTAAFTRFFIWEP